MPTFTVRRDVQGYSRGHQIHTIEAATETEAISIAEGLDGCGAEENIVRDDRDTGEWEIS